MSKLFNWIKLDWPEVFRALQRQLDYFAYMSGETTESPYPQQRQAKRDRQLLQDVSMKLLTDPEMILEPPNWQGDDSSYAGWRSVLGWYNVANEEGTNRWHWLGPTRGDVADSLEDGKQQCWNDYRLRILPALRSYRATDKENPDSE